MKKSLIIICVLCFFTTSTLFALAYINKINNEKTIERMRVENEMKEAVLKRKEKCLELKSQYIKNNEPTTDIFLDEVVYNEQHNTCYYWYTTSQPNGLSEAIADLYSNNIIGQTAPECSGKWCLSKTLFDQEKTNLGFQNHK